MIAEKAEINCAVLCLEAKLNKTLVFLDEDIIQKEKSAQVFI